MEIKKLPAIFSVCKVEDYTLVDEHTELCFTGKTDEENSLGCPTDKAPANTTDREDGWKMFRIQGVLDFSLIGILADISRILAENKIGIFVISTFNTDYILTKEENYQKALDALSRAGYKIIEIY